MAGNELYIGKIFEDLATKLENQLVALQNINTSVAQTVTALNIKAGITKNVTVNAADVGYTAVSSGEIKAVRTMTVLCNGVVRFKGQVKTSNAGYPAYLTYSLNGGAAVVSAATPGTVYVEFTHDIPVKFGDVLTLGMKCYNAGTVYTMKAGATLSYDLIDIVNEGAFA